MILGIFFVNTVFILFKNPEDDIEEMKNPQPTLLQKLKGKLCKGDK